MQQVNAIIFDLGGVLINLAPNKTRDAFIALGIPHFEELFTVFKATPLFDDLETGRVQPTDFIQKLQQEAEVTISEEQIVSAWNAMLLDFRLDSLDFIRSLREKYPVFLYSNTNRIHYEAFEAVYRDLYPDEHFNDLFNKAYYSHEIGYRKPEIEGYLHIINDQGLSAGNTLFVDDNAGNIEGAKLAGLLTHHLGATKRIENVLTHLVD
jgi:HAD superfamily hydrolase (TIGR01509 family)